MKEIVLFIWSALITSGYWTIAIWGWPVKEWDWQGGVILFLIPLTIGAVVYFAVLISTRWEDSC